MEIILREDVQHLGAAGDVVKVKDGYASNYLLPKGLAYPATEANKKKIAYEAERIARQRAAEKGAAETEAAKLAGGALFGGDRKSTRLNSSHSQISYAVFCLKKKKNNRHTSKAALQTRPAPIDAHPYTSCILTSLEILTRTELLSHTTTDELLTPHAHPPAVP